MKIAISGKGGTGKTTIASLLAHCFQSAGYQVLAVDADPDANLASAIGFLPETVSSIIPISQQRKLIEERTGAKAGQFGQLFKMNPRVEDIPEEFSLSFRGIRLLVMGGVQKGGEGCACPENVLLRKLLSEIVLNRGEVVIMDMEAGIEHLGRGTSRAIDKMVIVVEPGLRSLQTAQKIMKLSRDIGIQSFGIVVNKIQDESQKHWVFRHIPESLILGTLSYNKSIPQAELNEKPLVDVLDDELKKEMDVIFEKLNNPIQTK